MRARPQHRSRRDVARPKRPSGDVLGFTLLEVMIAIAILGLSLTVILSAQVGLHSTGARTQSISIAMGLSRCKMSEVEEQLLKLGYPELDTMEEGPCCGDDSRQDLRCRWKVERIELPIPIDSADGGTSTAASAALANATAGATAPPMIDPATGLPATPPPGSPELGATAPAGATAAPIPGTVDFGGGPLGALGAGGLTLPPGVTGGGNGMLAGVLSAGASGGMGALAPMVMTFVYPSLKSMLEASIRKVTVTVSWREGITRRELEIVQWVTNPMKGGFLSDAIESASAGTPGGSPGGNGQSGRSGGNPPLKVGQ